jgi:hypothetical protein
MNYTSQSHAVSSTALAPLKTQFQEGLPTKIANANLLQYPKGTAS